MESSQRTYSYEGSTASFSPVDRNPVSHTVFGFGKYNGKTYEFVRQTDVAYCNWALKQMNVNGKMQHFQQWLKSKSRKVTCECCNGSGLVDAV